MMVGIFLVAAVKSSRVSVMVFDPYGNESFLGHPDPVSGGQGAKTHRAVLYDHWGAGIQEGGDLPKTVRKLADEEVIACAKKRSGTSILVTLSEVENGLDGLLDLTSGMLQGRSIASSATDPGISIIGYSRGGLMALRIAELQATATKPFVQIDTVTIQAAAAGGNLRAPGTSGQWIDGGATTFTDAITINEYLADEPIGGTDNIGMINAATSEFFLLAANNDNPPNNLVDLVTAHNQLVNRDVTPFLKIYNGWIPQGSGHQLFESVEDGGKNLLKLPGYYWHDAMLHFHGPPVTESTSLLPESNSIALRVLGAAACPSPLPGAPTETCLDQSLYHL